MLTKTQTAFYKKNGYLAVENVLTMDEVEELRRVTDEFVEKSRSVTQHTDVFDLEPGHTPEAPRLRRLKNPAHHHPVYDRAMRHDRILDLIAQLIGPSIRQNGHKLNMKSAGYGSPVEWHQDWAFYPHTNDDLLAVGVCLDDMRLDNGCLLVIPGSHKGPIYNHHQNGVFVGGIADPRFNPDRERVVPVEVKAGGISLHHVRMLHGSAPNVSNAPRRLLLFQYCAIDAWPLTGVSDWKAFNDCIMRGEPTHQPRLVPVPVRIPLPPAERGGSIYEVQTLMEQPVFRKKAG
ncbi:MAG: phytanoyl-CoA dioxygenase family protein [Candidatus Latescibacteria bacterium]|nr:phytanoyl-CoA dioxygenase family protein [Candidatus Latescibacterota bacterium]